MWRRPTNAHVLLQVRANGDCLVALVMTHAEVAIQCVHQSTEYNFVWSSASVGCESGPPTRVRNKKADRCERKTPRPPYEIGTGKEKETGRVGKGVEKSETHALRVHPHRALASPVRETSESSFHALRSHVRSPTCACPAFFRWGDCSCASGRGQSSFECWPECPLQFQRCTEGTRFEFFSWFEERICSDRTMDHGARLPCGAQKCHSARSTPRDASNVDAPLH